MEPTMIKDISLLLNAVGVGNCFLLSYTYLIKKGPKTLKANHILSFLFFVLGVAILNTILNFSGYNHLFYGFEPLSNALSFAIAPLLFLYVRSLNPSNKCITIWSGHMAFFYGFTALTIACLSFPLGIPGQWGRAFIQSPWANVLWNLHFMGYLIALIMELRKADKNGSPTSMIIVWGTVSIWAFNLLFFVYRTWVQPLPMVVYLNITLLFSLMTIYLFYRKFAVGVEQGRKVTRKKSSDEQNFNPDKDPVYLAIQENKYYKNPDLDIRTLSEQLLLPYHELSSYINKYYGQNFNAFINSFRIKEVVNGLESEQHQAYTIMGLAQEAGFKSASAFYAAFKKEKGTTPSVFLKRSA